MKIQTLLTLALALGIFVIWIVVKPATPQFPYQNRTLSDEKRIDDLIGRMTVDEKIGQLALVEKDSLTSKDDIAAYGLGGLLSGGSGKPDPNTPQAWVGMVNEFQEYAKKSRLGIPLLFGVDAVHGNGNVPGATIFPHAIGLGASGDSGLVRRIGKITAREMLATGVNWNYAPNLDVPQDYRWGRTYETFGSDTGLVSRMGVAYLQGLQSGNIAGVSAIGTAKHYIGAGAMGWGTSKHPKFSMDQGTVATNEETLRAVHLPPFAAVVNAGVDSVMIAHLTWEGKKLISNQHMLREVLKEELGFKGFVVSDWYGVYEIPGDQYDAIVTAINAGVDMVMLPYDYKTFVNHMQKAIAAGDISEARLDDAVRRILRAKFASGLFDYRTTSGGSLHLLGSSSHRKVAREAVRKSLVLLKGDIDSEPISKTTSHILVAGSAANNLGQQMGGWTVEWQGIDGNWTPGTTILDGIKQTVSSNTTVDYEINGKFENLENPADVGIVVVGEKPYAEGIGDNEHPRLTDEDLQAIANVESASKKLVVIIVSGRPLDIKNQAKDWDNIIAAWLPGSEGGGVADVLFGDYRFTGTLPVEWDGVTE